MSDLLITRKNTDRIGFRSVLLPLLIINITIFANVIGELTVLLFHYLFCRVLIEQCDRTDETANKVSPFPDQDV